MGEKLLKSDVEKIEKEIEYRKNEGRNAILADLKEARAQGDLSENFEYHAAKRERGKNEGRIRYLENMLRNATIIEDSSAEDEIGIDDTFTIYIEEDDECETYRLTTSIRSDTLKDRISIESPLGKAVMKKKVGDRVYIRVDENYGYYAVIKSIDKTTTSDNDEIMRY
ncbi:MAG: transcription elongation factor GreA [Lachnospiraceae bacterium]|nr:transcription elongation factor GreA [Lachnospiraceae bacterium]